MTINLNIGPERERREQVAPASRHILNMKDVDEGKRAAARREPVASLKEEIRSEEKDTGRICIVGELPRSKQGLGRAPMILAALMIVFLLSASQVVFLGKKKGGEALALASEALVSLQSASQSIISGEEGADMLLFTEAELLFQEAEAKGSFLLGYDSPWIIEPSQVTSLRNVLDAGELMAEIGQHISSAKSSFMDIPDEGSLTEFINSVSTNDLEPATDKMGQILTLMDEVDLSGTGYEMKFYDYREKLQTLKGMFDLWVDSKDAVLAALGDRYPQHYLVLLMNNDEMRLGGGFIGSFAIVEINDGRLTDLVFHDVYEFDNRYNEHVEVPVHELRSLTEEWRLRDSNISPDFAVSAQQAMHFLDLEGGPGVDGVIAVNLSAAQAMVEELGSLTLASLQKPLTAETFPAVLSTLIEAKTFGSFSPKTVLKELIDAFVAKATGAPEGGDVSTDFPAGDATFSATTQLQMQLGLRILDEAHKKQILFYHKNEDVQDLITSFDMDATIPDLTQLTNEQTDFLLPAFTNIAGNKTDRYMETDIQHATQILEDGAIINSATITRTHTFNDASLAWLKQTAASYGFTAWNEGLEKILGNDTNKSGIRIYIPANSQILDVTGSAHRDDLQFYYDKFEDISYYYIDQTLQPGESQSFTVTYSLPWKFTGEFQEYNFTIFKQPGLKAIQYTKSVTAPSDIMLSSEPLATAESEETDYILSGSLKSDTSLTLLYR